jgi:hypothetical protein
LNRKFFSRECEFLGLRVVGRQRLTLVLFGMFLCGSSGTPAGALAEDVVGKVEDTDAETRAMWLIRGEVVNAVDDEPIESFVAVPGTMSNDADGKSVIRWRENLQREMRDGKFLWPRTSGFSLMRFRVRAKGFFPAITPQLQRGGPHTRMKIRMVPVPNELPPEE